MSMQINSECKATGVLKPDEDGKKLQKEEWKKRLTPLQYCICRESDTERVSLSKLSRLCSLVYTL